jgi:hypothetical protein
VSVPQAAWPSDHLKWNQRDPADDKICAQLVLDAYANALRSASTQRDAFRAAVRVWQEQNPKASSEMARAAVATILCKKL